MTNEVEAEWESADQPISLKRPRRMPWILALLAVLATAGAGAVYFGMNVDSYLLSGRDTPVHGEASAGDRAMLTDLLATQQKTTDDLAVLNRSVAAQREQLKSITDQLAALSSKVEALKSAAALPPPPVSVQPSAGAQAVPKATKKPPVVPKPTGATSVGGAPLGANNQ